MRVAWIDEDKALNVIRREIGSSLLAVLEKTLALALDAGVRKNAEGLVNQQDLREFLASDGKKSSSGRPPKYDWDAMWIFVIKRCHEKGFPEIQAVLVKDITKWFEKNYPRAPVESQIREKVSKLYQAMDLK